MAFSGPRSETVHRSCRFVMAAVVGLGPGCQIKVIRVKPRVGTSSPTGAKVQGSSAPTERVSAELLGRSQKGRVCLVSYEKPASCSASVRGIDSSYIWHPGSSGGSNRLSYSWHPAGRSGGSNRLSCLYWQSINAL